MESTKTVDWLEEVDNDSFLELSEDLEQKEKCVTGEARLISVEERISPEQDKEYENIDEFEKDTDIFIIKALTEEKQKEIKVIFKNNDERYDDWDIVSSWCNIDKNVADLAGIKAPVEKIEDSEFYEISKFDIKNILPYQDVGTLNEVGALEYDESKQQWTTSEKVDQQETYLQNIISFSELVVWTLFAITITTPYLTALWLSLLLFGFLIVLDERKHIPIPKILRYMKDR